MATLTVAAQPANVPPRVQLTAAGFSGAELSIVRNDPDGRTRPVRSAEPAPLLSGSWAGFDYEAPFGEAVTYTAIPTAGSSVTSSAATVTVSDVWLVHPGIPDLSVSFTRDNVGKLESRSRAARTTIHRPIGRVKPIAVSESRDTTESGITVLTDTTDEENAVWALLESGMPLLLNVPPSLGWGISSEWMSVGDVTEDYFNRGLSGSRVFALAYTVVDRPVGALVAEWTYAGVLTTYATYADVLANYDSYTDLLTNTTNA